MEFPKEVNNTIDLVLGFEKVERIKKMLKEDKDAIPIIAEMIEKKRNAFEATPYGKELIEYVEGLI